MTDYIKLVDDIKMEISNIDLKLYNSDALSNEDVLDLVIDRKYALETLNAIQYQANIEAENKQYNRCLISLTVCFIFFVVFYICEYIIELPQMAIFSSAIVLISITYAFFNLF